MTERKQTEPGGWQIPPGSVDPQDVTQDDIPTRPEAVDRDVLAMARLFGDLDQVNRRKVVMLMQNWRGCTRERQFLIEMLARELHEKDQIAR